MPSYHYSIFADDICLIVAGRSIQEVSKALGEVGDSAINLGKEHKIEFEVES